jgi:alanine racemase
MADGVTVKVDIARIRRNVEDIARRTRVPVLAVVKGDAYGLGIAPVVDAIADLVEAWCVFSAAEAVDAKLWERTGKGTITLSPPSTNNPKFYLKHHIRPAVTTVEQAQALRPARPILCIDTGMQRFACSPTQVDAALRAGDISEAFTQATRMEHVHKLKELAGDGRILHAAATKLLDQPEAWLNAVRPGLAIYRGATKVSAPLIETHDTAGPAGYTGFLTPRHGVILCGYSNGLRKGPCIINGQRHNILEVGMQSAFVEIGPADRVGDEVVLLGDGLTEEEVAAAWATTPQEVLVRLGKAGKREYA